MSTPAVVLFAKSPTPGLAKTRLAVTVGAAAAARVAAALLDDALAALSAVRGARLWLSVPGEVAEAPWTGVDWPVVPQLGGDLGARIERSLRGAGVPAFAVGADTLAIQPAVVERAIAAIDAGVAVMGRAEDGGFWLLGLPACPEGLLAGLPWSDPSTASAVVARLKERGFDVVFVETARDVDVWDDLVVAAQAPDGAAPRTSTVARELLAQARSGIVSS